MLVFLLLAFFPCAVYAETITQEQYAQMQSLPELYSKYGSVLRTHSVQVSGNDFKDVEWVWYSETEEQKPVLGIFDGAPSLVYDGVTYGYDEEGALTVWVWLSGWEEALEKWTAPVMELPEEKVELISEEDGSYSLLYQSHEKNLGDYEIFGSLDSQKNISSVITIHNVNDTVVQSVLTFLPMASPLVGLDMDALMQDGMRQITYVRKDGTEQTIQVPQLVRVGWMEDGEACQAFLNPECTESVMYLPAGAESIIVYEGKTVTE